MNMRPLAAGLTAAALTIALSACSSDSEEKTSEAKGTDGAASAITTVADGKLTVCSDLPYAPFEFEDPESPSGFSGFDIDVVQFVADELELELSVVPTAFGPIQSGAALNASQCDVAASAITINDERKAVIDFSAPYFDASQSLLVPSGSDITAIADLDGKNVGVQDATTGQAYATDNAEGASIVAFPDDGKMFQALKAGSVDALLQDLGVNALHTEDGGFEIVETYSTDEQYGLAMKKGNTALVEAVDAALVEMRDNGAYDEVHAKYFG